MPKIMTNKEKALAFSKELLSLMEKYKVSISVDICGDTHGITEDFAIDTGGETFILNECCGYLDTSDLREYIEDNDH